MFTPKTWHDYDTNTGTGNPDTPVSGAAMTELETRVGAEFTAAKAAGDATYVPATQAPLSVLRYGAKFDGITNDTAAIQATFDAAPAGSTVSIPFGNGLITAPIHVTKAVTVVGTGSYTSRIYADGCNGFEVDAGVIGFQLQNLEIAAKVRYTTTTNILVGIKVAGTTGSRPASHVYRDVYVDGFRTAFQSCYLWSSNFDNFSCGFGLIGIDIYGLSVNNFIYGGSEINVARIASSRGIRFAGQESSADVSPVGSEGWTVTGNLIYGAEIGVEIIGNAHLDISDNIIDFNDKYGVYLHGNAVNFAGNCKISGNYIAMSGAAGAAGIGLANAISHAQNAASRVESNHIVVYAGSVCAVGIDVVGAQSRGIIRGNLINGMTTDITLATAGSIVTGNQCLSTPGAAGNIYPMSAAAVNLISNNVGIVYLFGGNPNVYAVNAMGKRIFSGLQAPTAGTFVWGDQVENCRPTVGQPKGWLCSVAGTPGTWVSTGNL